MVMRNIIVMTVVAMLAMFVAPSMASGIRVEIIGKYITDDKEGALVEIILSDGNKFAIHREFVSYIPNGEYIINEDKLVFIIGSEVEYTFSYKDDMLIFESGTWLENWIEPGTVLMLSNTKD